MYASLRGKTLLWYYRSRRLQCGINTEVDSLKCNLKDKEEKKTIAL